MAHTEMNYSYIVPMYVGTLQLAFHMRHGKLRSYSCIMLLYRFAHGLYAYLRR
jgi:hypothetical protein